MNLLLLRKNFKEESFKLNEIFYNYFPDINGNYFNASFRNFFFKQISFELRRNTDALFYFFCILIQFSLSASRADTLYCLFVIPS